MNIDFLSNGQKIFFAFCVAKHGSQKRKYTGDPYWYHLVNVAKILYDAGFDDLIEIGLGHDLLEDTDATDDEIFFALKKAGYSNQIAGYIVDGIIALTDIYTKEAFPDWNRKRRKSEEAQRLGRIFSRFQTVKYADLLDNSKDILKNDPKFAKVYLQEKKEILQCMNQGDERLFIRCEARFDFAIRNESNQIHIL